MSEQIGLYGGSFDPIHFGHLISARAIGEQLDLASIVLIPSRQPPHKAPGRVSEAAHRLAMTRLAVEGDAFFEVSDIEMHRAGPSYTLDTIVSFRERIGGDAKLFWIIGADSLPELPTWYRVAELVRSVTIVTAVRPGWRLPDLDVLAPAVGEASAKELLSNCCLTPPIGISATDIRARIAAGRSVRYLLPEAVMSYIEEHALYKT
jgi:nicotinate-nucleotide adenylyltransferase